MEPHRFTFQSNQFTGECLPCPKTTFYNVVKSASVYNTITTRQAIEKAIDDGQPLDNWINCANFRSNYSSGPTRRRCGCRISSSVSGSLPPYPRQTRTAISSSTMKESPFSSVAVCNRVSENSAACLCSTATTCQ